MPKEDQILNTNYTLLAFQFMLMLLAQSAAAEESLAPENSGVQHSNELRFRDGFMLALIMMFGYKYIEGLAAKGLDKLNNKGTKTPEKPKENKITLPILPSANIPQKGLSSIIGYTTVLNQLKTTLKLLEKPEDQLPAGFIKPRVILLSGPPGNGKTTIASALAGESHRHFVKVSGGNILTSFQGSGSTAIADAFDNARTQQSSLIFIDEIDGFALERSDKVGDSIRLSEVQALLTLLEKIDEAKADKTKDIVIVLATNHRKKIDEALISRSNKEITIPDPDKQTRQLLIEHFSKRFNPDNRSIDVNILVEKSVGLSVRRLEDVFTNSYQEAFNRDPENPVIQQDDLEEAIMGKSFGQRTHHEGRNADELREVALHEAGHALVHYIMKRDYGGTGRKLDSVTILSRSDYEGGCIFTLEQEGRTPTKQQLLNFIAVQYGGAAVESRNGDNNLTLRIGGDYQNIHDIVTTLLSFGMAAEKNFTFFYPPEEKNTLSDATKQRLESEEERLSKSAYETAQEIIRTYPNALEALQEALLKEETISGERAMTILEQAIPPRLDSASSLKI